MLVMVNNSKAYAAAGVNIDLADHLKEGLGKLVARTRRPGVLGKIGGFGGLFQLDFRKYRQPVLVSSVDGVGTKLKAAAMMGRHNTVGQDLVNHCVNDIAVLGAEPLYFLDYIGTGRLQGRVFKAILEGITRGCAGAGCALIGGETAQLPDMYREGEYDLVGCIVGVVEKKRILDGSRVKIGDVLIGLPSSGLHTNGYSLAREILFVKLRHRLEEESRFLGCRIGDELLKIHRNYWPIIKDFIHPRTKPCGLHALIHITGGGFLGNIPRVLPKTCDAVIHSGTWPVLPIFRLLQQEGHVDEMEMFEVFNMGVGMVMIVEKKQVDRIMGSLRRRKEPAYVIGEIRKGKQRVLIQ